MNKHLKKNNLLWRDINFFEDFGQVTLLLSTHDFLTQTKNEELKRLISNCSSSALPLFMLGLLIFYIHRTFSWQLVFHSPKDIAFQLYRNPKHICFNRK